MISGREEDLLRAFWVGSRFDLKITTIAFAPLFLLGLGLAAFPSLFAGLRKAIPYYACLIFFLITAFSIGNYYYYTTFGNFIDVFVFGLFDDDTEAVLVSMWEDYPIVLSSLATIMVTVAGTWLVRRFQLVSANWQPKPRHWSLVSVLVIVTIGAYASLARGSLSTLPLKRYHANVSDYDVLNKITPNAFMALDWARSDYKKQATFSPASISSKRGICTRHNSNA